MSFPSTNACAQTETPDTPNISAKNAASTDEQLRKENDIEQEFARLYAEDPKKMMERLQSLSKEQFDQRDLSVLVGMWPANENRPLCSQEFCGNCCNRRQGKGYLTIVTTGYDNKESHEASSAETNKPTS